MGNILAKVLRRSHSRKAAISHAVTDIGIVLPLSSYCSARERGKLTVRRKLRVAHVVRVS
jgi:hypothetical protein